MQAASPDVIMLARGDHPTAGAGRRRPIHKPTNAKFATAHLTTGLRLHYAEQGDREEEAIIFLHAYADSWFSYGRVLPLLSPAYHAFALDQRGHGDSDKPECCYAADDYAADVDAFMEAVGIDEATLVGDSSGGLIAQRVALDYPHRVGGQRGGHGVVGVPAHAGRSDSARVRQGAPGEHNPLLESIIHHPVPEEFLERAISQSLKVP